jgi:hypothetical protein
MKDRIFSVSGWGFMLGAGVCALLAVLLATPADVFADDPPGPIPNGGGGTVDCTECA